MEQIKSERNLCKSIRLAIRKLLLKQKWNAGSSTLVSTHRPHPHSIDMFIEWKFSKVHNRRHRWIGRVDTCAKLGTFYYCTHWIHSTRHSCSHYTCHSRPFFLPGYRTCNNNKIVEMLICRPSIFPFLSVHPFSSARAVRSRHAIRVVRMEQSNDRRYSSKSDNIRYFQPLIWNICQTAVFLWMVRA